MSDLQVRGVSVDFGGAPVLDSVDLTVAAGEIVALLGPSGSGKSTLLRVIAGIQPPTSGRINIEGQDVTRQPTHRRRVGMVFQDNQLFPHRDVLANVEPGGRKRSASMRDSSRKPPGFRRRSMISPFVVLSSASASFISRAALRATRSSTA